MCKSELFRKLLKLTAEETEIAENRIIGKDTDMESTDARYILATLLYEHGLYPSQIAPMLNRTSRSIRWLIQRSATSPMVGIILERIRRNAGND